MAKQSFRETKHELPHQKPDEIIVSTKSPVIKRRQCQLGNFISPKELQQVIKLLPADFSRRFQLFREKYRILQNSELKQSEQNVQQNTQDTAQRIKQEHPFLLQNIGYFLYKHGILLFCVSKELFDGTKTRDGYCQIPKDSSEYPIVIIAKDEHTPRRKFFTIAHEVYHLLSGEDGEFLANKFAGAMLITKQEIMELLQLNPKNPVIKESELEQCLKTLYQYFPVSLECIIFTLFDYQFIPQNIKRQYTGKSNAQKRKQMIKSWDLPLDLEAILDSRSLLNQYKINNNGSLCRSVENFANIQISEGFNEPMPSVIWQRLE